MLDIDISMNNWLSNVEEKEHWNEWEHDSCKVSGKTNIELAISFERGKSIPESVWTWLGSKRNSLLSEALDVLVDVAFQLGFHLHSLDHLHDLLLFVFGFAVNIADFLKALMDVVLETFTHFIYFIN